MKRENQQWTRLQTLNPAKRTLNDATRLDTGNIKLEQKVNTTEKTKTKLKLNFVTKAKVNRQGENRLEPTLHQRKRPKRCVTVEASDQWGHRTGGLAPEGAPTREKKTGIGLD